MRRLPAIGLLVALLAVVGCGDDEEPEPEPVRWPLGTMLAGGELSTADFDGDVVLVFLWASWAAPCRAALPGLDSLQAELGDCDHFRLVAASLDGREEDLVGFLERNPVSFLVTRDTNGAVQDSFKVRGVPTYVLLDLQGAKRWSAVGFRPTAEVRRAVLDLLESIPDACGPENPTRIERYDDTR